MSAAEMLLLVRRHTCISFEVQGTLNASDDQYRVDGDELHNVGLYADELIACELSRQDTCCSLYRSHLWAKSYRPMKRLLTYLLQ